MKVNEPEVHCIRVNLHTLIRVYICVLYLLLESLMHSSRATGQAEHLLTPPTTLTFDNNGSLTRCVRTWLAHMARITTLMAAVFPLEGTGLLAAFKSVGKTVILMACSLALVHATG